MFAFRPCYFSVFLSLDWICILWTYIYCFVPWPNGTPPYNEFFKAVKFIWFLPFTHFKYERCRQRKMEITKNKYNKNHLVLMNYIASSVTKYVLTHIHTYMNDERVCVIVAIFSMCICWKYFGRKQQSQFRTQNRPTHIHVYWLNGALFFGRQQQQQLKRVISVLCNMNCNDRFLCIHTSTFTHSHT